MKKVDDKLHGKGENAADNSTEDRLLRLETAFSRLVGFLLGSGLVFLLFRLVGA